MNVEASILARITKRVKIILIGNPLPVIKHPLRMAEELATIDLISRGRLVAGWVRGAGSEQFFNNANPAYNREMFEEAHDFIIQAWTRPGPWRYEGKHFHYRHVNPWVLPYQKPHPPMLIPGVLSPETVLWSRRASLPLHRPRHRPRAHHRAVGHLRRHGGRARLPGRPRELRLPHPDVRGRHRGEGPGAGQGLHLRRRAERLLPPRVHAAAGLQLQGRHQAAGQDAGRHLARASTARSSCSRPPAAPERRRLRRGAPEAAGRLPEGPGQLPAADRHARHGPREGQDHAQGAAAGHVHLLRPAGPVGAEDRIATSSCWPRYVVPEIKAYADELGLDDPFSRGRASPSCAPARPAPASSTASPLAELGLR